MVQNDEGENQDFKFNSEKGGEDKACVAEIQKADESSDETTSEETKTILEDSTGSESERTSDSNTQGDSDAEFEEPTTQFSIMVNTNPVMKPLQKKQRPV